MILYGAHVAVAKDARLSSSWQAIHIASVTIGVLCALDIVYGECEEGRPEDGGA